MAQGKIKGITIEIGGSTTKLDEALSKVNKKSKGLQDELKQVNKLLKLDPKNTELLAQKQKLLGESIKNAKEKLDTLKEAERQAQEQFKKGEISQEAYNELKREVIATEQYIKSLEKQARACNSTMLKISEAAGKIGEKAEAAGKKLTPLSAAIGAAGVAAVKMGSDFNDAAAKASTLVDTTVYDMEQLKEGLLEVSNETGVAADQLAESMYNALSASVELGEDGADMMAFLQSNTRLAKVGFTDIDTAVTATAKTLNAYNMDVSETDRIHRILLQTQNRGITTVGELGQNLAKVTPTAAAMGVSFENVGAALATMTAQGTPTAQATTQLNALISELGKEGTKSSKILKEKTGKSFKELMESGMSLGDVLDIMGIGLSKNAKKISKLMSETDKATGATMTFEEACEKLGISSGSAEKELIDMFGSLEAGKAALALGGENAEKFAKNLDTMSDSTNIVGEAFEKLDTDSNKAKIAINQLKNVGITLGKTMLNALRPTLEKITNKIKDITKWFGNLTEGQKKTILTIAGIAAAIGPLLIMLGKLASGISAITSVMHILAANPVFLWITGGAVAIAAIAGIVSAISAATDEGAKLRKKLSGIDVKVSEDSKTNISDGINAGIEAADKTFEIELRVSTEVSEVQTKVEEAFGAVITGAKNKLSTKELTSLKSDVRTFVGGAIDEVKATTDAKAAEVSAAMDNLGVPKEVKDAAVAGVREKGDKAIADLESYETSAIKLLSEMGKAGGNITQDQLTQFTELLRQIGIIKTEIGLAQEGLDGYAEALHNRVLSGLATEEDIAQDVSFRLRMGEIKQAEIEQAKKEGVSALQTALDNAESESDKAQIQIAIDTLWADSDQQIEDIKKKTDAEIREIWDGAVKADQVGAAAFEQVAKDLDVLAMFYQTVDSGEGFAGQSEEVKERLKAAILDVFPEMEGTDFDNYLGNWVPLFQGAVDNLNGRIADNTKLVENSPLKSALATMLSAGAMEDIDISQLPASLQGMLAALDFKQSGGEISGQLCEGMGLGFSENQSISEEAAKTAMQGIIDSAKKELGIESPSKVFKEMGQMDMAGLDEGHAEGAETAKSNLVSLLDDMLLGIKEKLADVSAWFQTAFETAYTNVTTIFQDVGQWFTERWTDITTAFSSVGTWFQTTFENAWTNVQDVFNDAGTFFQGVWDIIVEKFTSIGKAIGDAVSDAFKTSMNSVFSLVETTINNFIDAINGAIGTINKIQGVSLKKVETISIPRLAKGGILKEGQAIMAEAGPELIRMVNGQAIVTPLTRNAKNTAVGGHESQANGGGSGSGFTQNVNIHSPKALSPYEIERHTRNATRSMVLKLQRG